MISYLLFGIFLNSNVKGSSIEKVYCNSIDCFSRYKTVNHFDGYYQFYLVSGNDTFLSREGMILNKMRQGDWVYYHRNKSPYRKVFMVNDTVNGAEICWTETGKLESIGIYKGNVPLGLHLTFYGNGIIRSERIFNSEGKKEGVQREYYESGKIMFEEIFPIENADLNYNSNTCGDESHTLSFMLNSGEEFHGNEWYENGQKKIECSTLKQNPYTIQVLKFDNIGNIIMKGNLVYTKRDRTCWFKIGAWTYFNIDGSILKQENH